MFSRFQFAQIGFRVRSLFAKRKLDEQLSEEIRVHVEMATAANVAAAARELYTDPQRRWLRTQVLAALNEREAFIKRSETA